MIGSIADMFKGIAAVVDEAGAIQANVHEYAWDAASHAAAVAKVEERMAQAGGAPLPVAHKHDHNKTWRPGLIAVEFIQGIATILAFGANKYSAGNWALGMEWSRPIDALDRHWTAWKGGEKCDAETGHSHLWHAGCCLMFLVAYEARGIGRDDRAEVGMMAAKGSRE